MLCLQLYVKTGSIYEKSSERGYSHFIEHLVFKSTTDFPANSISRQATELGGLLNAYTDFDTTCYYLLLPSENLRKGLQILSQLAMHSTFSEADVNLEKNIIIEEIKQYKNDPEADHIDWIQQRQFVHSPLKHPVLGTRRSVTSATWNRLMSFYRRIYRPQNSVLVVTGNFTQDQLNMSFESYFGAWQRSALAIREAIVSEPELTQGNYRFRRKAISEDMLSFVVPELCEKHPLANALLLAIRYYAIGKSSRLHRILVEEKKLCSSVKVTSLSGVLSGVSVIMCTPIISKAIPEIVAIVESEFKRLQDIKIPEEELRLIKQDVIHGWQFSFEGVENLANLIGAEELSGTLETWQDYAGNILAVSHADITEALKHYWNLQNLFIYHEGKKRIAYSRQEELIAESETHESYVSISDPITIAFPDNKPDHGKITQIAENHYQIFLSNGMQLIYRCIPNKTVSGFTLSTSVCQLSEQEAQRGFNYFCSSLLLYSSQLHDHESLMRLGREYGFNIRVVQHLDTTSFRGKCNTLNLYQAMTVLAEIIAQPRFDRDYLKLMKTATLDRLIRDRDYPPVEAHQRWFQLLTGKRTNLGLTCGSAAQIKRIKLSDLENWYHNYNLAVNFSLGLVSSQPVAEIAAICDTLFGIKQPSNPTTPLPYYEQNEPRTLKQRMDTEQAIINLGGFACPANNHQENAAFYLVSQILGGDVSSRLMDILREKHGLAYQVGFDFQSIKELGFWNLSTYCDRSRSKDCIHLIYEILADLADRGVEEGELNAAKQFLIGMNRFDRESSSYSAASMSNLAVLGYTPEYYLTREDRIRKVSTADIKHIAAKYLNPTNFYLHIMV